MRNLRAVWMAGVLAAAVMGTNVAFGDTVLMEDGDKLTGTIEKITADTVEMTTKHAGHVTIKRADVKSMWSEKEVEVVTTEGPHKVYVAPAKEGAGWVEAPVVAPTPAVVPVVMKPGEVQWADLERYWIPIGPHWKNQLTLGLVNTTGNSNSTSFAGELAFNYKQGATDFMMRFGGEYGVTNDVPNAERFYNDEVYKRGLDEFGLNRWFAFAESHNVYDGIKGISFRTQDAIGLGYKIWKGEKLEVDLRAGPGVTHERLFDGTTFCDPSGLAGLHAAYIFNDHLSATEDIIYTNGLIDVDRYQASSETALNLKMPELARGVGVKFLFRDDYDSTTKAPSKHNDTRLVIGMTYEF